MISQPKDFEFCIVLIPLSNCKGLAIFQVICQDYSGISVLEESDQSTNQTRINGLILLRDSIIGLFPTPQKKRNKKKNQDLFKGMGWRIFHFASELSLHFVTQD